MTVETYYETEHQLEAFMHGAAQHVADTARKLQAERTQENYEAWLEAGRLFKRHQLDFYGVDCPKCDGRGTTLVGWAPRTFYTPPEPVEATCKLCRGWGQVLEAEAVNYYEREGLSQADARDLVERA